MNSRFDLIYLSYFLFKHQMHCEEQILNGRRAWVLESSNGWFYDDNRMVLE